MPWHSHDASALLSPLLPSPCDGVISESQAGDRLSLAMNTGALTAMWAGSLRPSPSRAKPSRK